MLFTKLRMIELCMGYNKTAYIHSLSPLKEEPVKKGRAHTWTGKSVLMMTLRNKLRTLTQGMYLLVMLAMHHTVRTSPQIPSKCAQQLYLS